MRKFTLALFSLLLLFATACAGNETPPSSPPENPDPATVSSEPQEEEPNRGVPVSVETVSGYIDITFPESWLGVADAAEFDSEKYVEENGFEKAVVNPDGTVLVTMTKEKHAEMLQMMEQGVLETITDYIEGKDAPYIKDITYTKDFRTITIDVEKEGYENTFVDTAPFILGVGVLYYQMLLEDESRVEIITRDIETGETLSTAIYPDAL